MNTDFQIIGLSLFIKKHSTLVIGDLHIGYEEALNKQGILIPRTQFKDIADTLLITINKIQTRKLKQIIINGDLKHEFGTISETEWRQTLKILDILKKHSEKIVLIKGNHDTILGPIAEKRNVEVKDYFILDDILFIHGHILDKSINEIINKNKIKTIIIGHEHPAVSLREGRRVEKYKCFLFGKYRKNDLIVTPSLNPVIEGADVLRGEVLSPFIEDISEFRVIVVNGFEVFDFGEVKGLK